MEPSEIWEKGVDLALKLLREIYKGFTMVPLGHPEQRIPLAKLARQFVDSARVGEEVDLDNSGRFIAGYLVFGIVLRHIEVIFNNLKHGYFYEGALLLRSLDEAMDMIAFFNCSRSQLAHMQSWYEGRVIPNRVTRRAIQNIWFDGRIYIENFTPEESRLIKETTGALSLMELFRSSGYRIQSRFVHHTSSAILEASDWYDGKELERLADIFRGFNTSLLRAFATFGGHFYYFLSNDDRPTIREPREYLHEMFFKDAEFCCSLANHYANKREAETNMPS